MFGATHRCLLGLILLLLPPVLALPAEPAAAPDDVIPVPAGRFRSLTNPPCSHCVDQAKKKLIDESDRVVAWIRGYSNGGGIPLRYFLSGPRVVNDTYGLFFYDPDGGYVTGFAPDKGYEFYGWHRGVMVVRGEDGTLWSALSGKAIAGPKKGQELEPIPTLVTDWGYWLQLHPESVAYDLFDGKKYANVPLPGGISREAQKGMGEVDDRLSPREPVVAVTIGDEQKAYPLSATPKGGAVMHDTVADQPIVIFFYGPTRSAAAYQARLDDQTLHFDFDGSVAEAPFVDRETRTRWNLAGRAVEGKLKGKALDWVCGVQCRWYAWAAEYPDTMVYRTGE